VPGQDPFDEYADHYEETVDAAIGASGESAEFFARLKARMVRQHLGDDAARAILDFGCGTGGLTRALSELFPRAAIDGCDVSEGSIKEAQSRGSAPEVTFAVHAEDCLPQAPESYDAAVAACVFHHIPVDRRPFWAKELHRVLKRNGKLFLFEHNPRNPLTVRVVRRVPFDRDAELLLAGQAIDLLGQAGFTVGRPHYYFFFPNLLRALRPLEPFLSRLPIGAQYLTIGVRG
jgi:SAM-dependent methyltransferase